MLSLRESKMPARHNHAGKVPALRVWKMLYGLDGEPGQVGQVEGTVAVEGLEVARVVVGEDVGLADGGQAIVIAVAPTNRRLTIPSALASPARPPMLSNRRVAVSPITGNRHRPIAMIRPLTKPRR